MRRSSFDAMDLEPNIETIEIKEIKEIKGIKEIKNDTKKININSCYIRIIMINAIIFISLIFFIIFLKIPKQSKEESKEEINLDENYERITPYDKEYFYVPIAATNDFHGYFFPEEEEFIHGNQTLKYKIGGIEYISKYISILKEEFGNEGILYLDSGDFFFRPYFPRYFDGNLMIDFFNLIGLNATTLGNHELLWKN